jgi:aminopeptidase-like protein
MASLAHLEVSARAEAVGAEMYDLVRRLYPICRSITGDGVRQTLAIIGERLPLRTIEVPSGTPAYDWTVPNEWNIRDAYVADGNGKRSIDFQDNNLHVVSYSIPVNRRMPFAELREHLFTIPEQPDVIPYRTSYYKQDWGFCLTHNHLQTFDPGAEYEVCIDSTLSEGFVTYGECYLPGKSEEEVLISCHICHPSLANDNLSGLAVAVFLGEALSERQLRYSYRFIFIPGTIGAITWLAQNERTIKCIRHGLVLTCLGDRGSFHYKKSRRGVATIDRAAAVVLRYAKEPAQLLEFSPYGYDERQYCSPGINLPVGCLMRSVWGTFPEYHTSADNLTFVHPEQLSESLHISKSIIDVVEDNRTYRNLNPYCEPQLGRRGLYGSIGGNSSLEEQIMARLWILNLSDGHHSLLDIAEQSGLPFPMLRENAELLRSAGLLATVSQVSSL